MESSLFSDLWLFWRSMVFLMGKPTNLIGVQCGADIIAKIDQRAKALGLSRSRYATLIFEKWVADGEKPVSDADRALTLVKGFYPKKNDNTPTATRPKAERPASNAEVIAASFTSEENRPPTRAEVADVGKSIELAGKRAKKLRKK